MNQLNSLNQENFGCQQKISLPIPEKLCNQSSPAHTYQNINFNNLNISEEINHLSNESTPVNGNCSPLNARCSQMMIGQSNEPSLLIVTNPIFLETVPFASYNDSYSQYCMWNFSNQIHNMQQFQYWGLQDNSFIPSNNLHFENLEQVKQVIGSYNPNLTKEEMYDEMLKHYQYQKVVEIDDVTHKEKITYICKYNEWNKVFTKTWNLLDHVRMHEGIRPFRCKHCPKSFTQKGNLKKHQIQHTIATLKERKRFKCQVCNKGYTEKYNLEVMLIYINELIVISTSILFLISFWNLYFTNLRRET